MITRLNVGCVFHQRRGFSKNDSVSGSKRHEACRTSGADVSRKKVTQAGHPQKSMPNFFIPFLWFVAAAAACATETSTALNALKLLPKEQAKNLAVIEARDGTPMPERWHLLVHDKESETGLREYVIAGGEIVASRIISQFAQSLTAQDVIGLEALKCDSDQVARIAQDYAMANNVTAVAMNYKLKKEGPDAAPLWHVTCFDGSGNELGHIVLSAEKGNVVSRDGFRGTSITQNRDQIAPQSISSPADDVAPAGDDAEQKPKQVVHRHSSKEPTGFFRRVGGKFQKFFTGKNTIGQ